MKPLISTEDFAFNQTNVFGSKLPFFIDDKAEYSVMRAHQNYGIMIAANMANRRFAGVLNTIKKVIEGKENAMNELREIYEEYNDETESSKENL